jgi:hypothetical protein
LGAELEPHAIELAIEFGLLGRGHEGWTEIVRIEGLSGDAGNSKRRL